MARLLSLDYDPVYGDDAVRSSFGGSRSVFDFDVVIWDPRESLSEYTRSATMYRGHDCLTDGESARLLADMVRRGDEFVEFLESGKTLVVIAPCSIECYVATGKMEYSGTGRNRQTTRIVDKIDFLQAMPTSSDARFLRASGNRIEVVGEGALSRLLRKYLPNFSYQTLIENVSGDVIARVAGTDRSLAVQAVSRGGGLFAILPVPDFVDDGESEDQHDPYVDPDEEVSSFDDELAAAFQGDLLEAVAQVTGVRNDDRPSWADEYRTAAQRDSESGLVEARRRLAEVRTQVSHAEGVVSDHNARDQLYLGTGRALELEVRGVLELLGGEVTEAEPGRTDWLVSFPEGRAVVEVKGVTKSAAERNAAQLEKWVAGSIGDDGMTAKGILVVNSWRTTPLAARTEPDFPHQMLDYSRARKHCLVTGLQLFLIRAEVTSDPTQAAKWRAKLMNTTGRLRGTKRWSTVIKHQPKMATEDGRTHNKTDGQGGEAND